MKLETLKERIANAEAKVEKKQKTIDKKTAWIAKKQEAMKTMNANDALWAKIDIDIWREDIERNAKEIAELQKAIEEYRNQLEGAEKRETEIRTLPETLKTMQTELVRQWDEEDGKQREFLKAQYRELGRKEFMKVHKFMGYEFMLKTDEEIHKDNLRDAEALIMNLVSRVKDHVGEITDWSGIHVEYGNRGVVLNGFVEGTNGKCRVESIGAGGYNIQKYHIRVLVKEF